MQDDELSIYRGRDIRISRKVAVRQPTLDQIERFGERRYFSAVFNLTSTGADLKWQLWCMKIDYTKISDYDLFLEVVSQIVSSRKKEYGEMMANPGMYRDELAGLSDGDLEEMLVNPLELILGGIDLADFELCRMAESGEAVLYDGKEDIVIDRAVYARIVDVVRKIHGLKRNNETPANERTKLDLIEDARDELMAGRPYKSVLKPLVSALSVICGQCGDDRIWNMPIGMFLDNVKRAGRIRDSELLLQGAYSGFASLKGIDKSRLDWAGDI